MSFAVHLPRIPASLLARGRRVAVLAARPLPVWAVMAAALVAGAVGFGGRATLDRGPALAVLVDRQKAEALVLMNRVEAFREKLTAAEHRAADADAALAERSAKAPPVCVSRVVVRLVHVRPAAARKKACGTPHRTGGADGL